MLKSYKKQGTFQVYLTHRNIHMIIQGKSLKIKD